MYSNKILALAHNYINYIYKEVFLLVFKAAYNKVFIEDNIQAAFWGSRLVLFNLDAVLLKLDVQLHTPSLATLEDTT